MEYRRRRNRAAARRAYTSASCSRRRNDEGASFFNILLLILMTAGLVYVFIATPVGAMIFGGIFGRGGEKATPEPAPTQALYASAEPTGTAPPLQSERFELPPLELYALQLGVYDSASNAQGLISSLRSLGAAGYALATEEGVRILASCYATEAAASSVCARLIEQGYACVVYPVECSGSILTVESDADKLSAIRACVSLSKSLIDKLNDEVIRFDSEQRSVEYGIAVANEMLENVRSARAALADINDPSGALKLVEEHFVELTGCFTRFVSYESENRVELSGRLKHLQIEVIDRYCALNLKLAEISKDPV